MSRAGSRGISFCGPLQNTPLMGLRVLNLHAIAFLVDISAMCWHR